jgi:hypothetical protein
MSEVALLTQERTVTSIVRAMAASTAEFTDWTMSTSTSSLWRSCCSVAAVVMVV